MSTNDAPDMSWYELGDCQGVDPDVFFPERLPGRGLLMGLVGAPIPPKPAR